MESDGVISPWKSVKNSWPIKFLAKLKKTKKGKGQPETTTGYSDAESERSVILRETIKRVRRSGHPSNRAGSGWWK